jgi:DNA-binding transcriptional regulator YiaG
MSWEVEYTDEFGLWWDGLNESEQEDIAFVVRLHAARRYCLSEATRQAMTGGMTNTCHSRTNCMTSTWRSLPEKVRSSAMAKKFRELYDRLPAPVRERVEARVHDALLELSLQELREARELTQQQLAEHLKSGQAAVSKLERRTDMYVSTLRRFIEAMGGELEIIARFPEGDVRITNFSGDPKPTRP